ncbi:DUF6416 domain-containing protein [Jidongwangia harbinensis]|uniref:DUF6416 domain-containing protein n=1 Tax=Jidongwangia harbinensis TaxID=2878561 RepID=UPI001CD9D934|nr:DUF6416 domain-containing protein [Jidongwangia harbinensis]
MSVAEISALSGNAFAGAHAIAGSLQPLDRLRVASGRRYAFYLWSASPGRTRYAIKLEPRRRHANTGRRRSRQPEPVQAAACSGAPTPGSPPRSAARVPLHREGRHR